MASSSCTIECWNESRRRRSSLGRGWFWNEKGMLQEVFISREKQNMNVSAHVWVQFETPLWNAPEGLERNLGSQFYPLFTTSPFLYTRYEKNLCKWVMLWKICLLSLLLRSLTTAFLRFLSGYDKNSHFHFAAAASFTVFEHISNLLILYEIQIYNFSILSSSENRRTLLKSRNGSI